MKVKVKYLTAAPWIIDFPNEYAQARKYGFLEKIYEINGWEYPKLIWNKRFELLKKYISEKNKLPTNIEIYEGYNIGLWCKKQREHYKSGKMAIRYPDRIALLEEMPEWKSYINTDIFYEKFDLLKKYISEKNKLPTSIEIYEGFNIGTWFKTQKENYRSGKMAIRYPERIVLLEEIIKSTKEKNIRNTDIFYEKFDLLKKYISEKNKLPTKREIYEGFNIGQWCKYQRVYYKNGKMMRRHPERIVLLESVLEWKWNMK